MKKTMYLLVLLLPVFTACTQQVQSESIRFFYSQECASCQQMKGFLEELMELNADLPMTMTDIDEDPEAWEAACQQAGIPVWGVPRMFIGDQIFAGFNLEEGELIYIPAYSGYMGYANCILAAIEEECGQLVQSGLQEQ